MVKIRLQGLLDEIAFLIKEMREKGFQILEESEPYANRGNSEFVRVYLTVASNT
ncbi:hypothetical protein [Desulforamulus reducens]|uniref:hypothetical protein n=1 Tax=Desulforamulus reducens TaxID=59610 RepID=UPI00031B8C2A|nr:hypothetical protein [Desulforamulus reducens]